MSTKCIVSNCRTEGSPQRHGDEVWVAAPLLWRAMGASTRMDNRSSQWKQQQYRCTSQSHLVQLPVPSCVAALRNRLELMRITAQSARRTSQHTRWRTGLRTFTTATRKRRLMAGFCTRRPLYPPSLTLPAALPSILPMAMRMHTSHPLHAC